MLVITRGLKNRWLTWDLRGAPQLSRRCDLALWQGGLRGDLLPRQIVTCSGAINGIELVKNDDSMEYIGDTIGYVYIDTKNIKLTIWYVGVSENGDVA